MAGDCELQDRPPLVKGDRCSKRRIGVGPGNLDNLERIIIPTLNATFSAFHSIRETLIREAPSTDLKAADLGLCIVKAKFLALR